MTIVGAPVKIIGKFQKQPAEILDYDVDYTDWFSNRTDTPAAVTPISVTVETGITLVSSVLTGLIVKIILSGGTGGTKYKTTVRLTTAAGLVKEADFTVAVKAV